MNITAIIPFRNGHSTIGALLSSLPAWMPVVIVDDQSSVPLQLDRKNTRVVRLDHRGYFSGAVNAGLKLAPANALVLNQDVALSGTAWLEFLVKAEAAGHGIAGHGQMRHPHWPAGYVQGQFMFLSRAAIDKVGALNEVDYPLWGATAELQLRMVRQGFTALAVAEVEGMSHARPAGEAFGESIKEELDRNPGLRDWLIRTPPMVSVIVTSRSYGRYLNDCVNSLVGGPTSMGQMLGQTFQSFEVIIVDDASDDETAEVGKSLASSLKAIRYIRRDAQGGTAAANNTGIRAAHGKFITILCADDMREPFGLESLYRVVEQDPRAVPYDDMWVVANGQRVRPWEMSEFGMDRILDRNMMHAGIMFARRGWEKAGGYPEIMDRGREDWAFNVALAAVGYCGKHVASKGYLYRREGQNRSLSNQGPEWRNFFIGQMRALFPRLYAGERPMGCCGGSVMNQPRSAGDTAPARQADAGIGAAGMTMLEYVGGNHGTETWYGSATKAVYVFGGSRKRGWVDDRDVSGFVKAFESGRRVFQVVEPAAAEHRAPLPVANELEAAPENFTEPVPPVETHPEPGSKPSIAIVTEDGSTVEGDPRFLTVRELAAILPSASEGNLREMLRIEGESPKPRKGVIDMLNQALGLPESSGS